jgi:hypothetical protein
MMSTDLKPARPPLQPNVCGSIASGAATECGTSVSLCTFRKSTLSFGWDCCRRSSARMLKRSRAQCVLQLEAKAGKKR